MRSPSWESLILSNNLSSILHIGKQRLQVPGLRIHSAGPQALHQCQASQASTCFLYLDPLGSRVPAPDSPHLSQRTSAPGVFLIILGTTKAETE